MSFSSGARKIGILECPRCKGSGLEPGHMISGTKCSLCPEGCGKVTMDMAVKYALEHGDTDPPPALSS